MSPYCVSCLKAISTVSALDLQTKLDNSELVYSSPALLIKIFCHVPVVSYLSFIHQCDFNLQPPLPSSSLLLLSCSELGVWEWWGRQLEMLRLDY